MAVAGLSERKKKPRKWDALTHTHTTNDALFLWLVFQGQVESSAVGTWDKGNGIWVGMATTTTTGTKGDEEGWEGVLYFDLEGRTGDVVVAPFYQQDVVATFAHQIVDLVLVASGVLDEHLVAGSFRSVNANE